MTKNWNFGFFYEFPKFSNVWFDLLGHHNPPQIGHLDSLFHNYIFSEKGCTTAWLLSNIMFSPIITLGFCKIKMHIVLSYQCNVD